MPQPNNLAAFIWSVADLLRGDFKRSEYGRIILPFTLLRRLECVLEPTREAVTEQHKKLQGSGIELDTVLPRVAGHQFYNTSPYSLGNLGETETRANLDQYITCFSTGARSIFEHFNFDGWLDRLANANLLYLIVQKFKTIDLAPETVSNHDMGLVFEELIRRFAESANDEAGEHFTPRDVVRLTTTMVFAPDQQALTGDGIIRTVYDCACGTGGFLSSGMELVEEWNPNAVIKPYGQELNPESWAIAMADMMIKGQDPTNIKLGNTLSDDQLRGEHFNYCLANPPFGVDWKKVQASVNKEHKEQRHNGRFGPGLPRVSDGSLLFLMHLIAKFNHYKSDDPNTHSRIGIILNGSPLFTGGAGSGESEIRRWVLENDWLETIVALPTDLFYNTGIATYIWLLSNHKPATRKGKVQLVNATDLWQPMRKSLGSKRRQISEEQIQLIAQAVDQFDDAEYAERVRVYPTTHFGYRRITVERPMQHRYEVTAERIEAMQAHSKFKRANDATQAVHLAAFQAMPQGQSWLSRDAFINALKEAYCQVTTPPFDYKAFLSVFGEHDPKADICLHSSGKKKGQPEADPNLRDHENVPLGENIHAYLAREVTPHVPNAWIDESKTDAKDGDPGIVGYEINFNRYFYQYTPPRPLEDIDAELKQVEAEIQALLGEVTA